MKREETSYETRTSSSSRGLFLKTVPTIVIAHTFCATPDTRIIGDAY